MPHLVAWLPLLVCLGLNFWFSHQPAPPVPPVFLLSDKLLHVGAYTVIGVLAARALTRTASAGRLAWVAALTLGIVWGVFDEWHQSFVPGRDASVLDALADAAGVVLGVGGYFAYARTRG